MSIDKTPLQKAIKEAIKKHPTLDDKEIAVISFEARYPDEEYGGSDPTPAYVSKMRKRLVQAGEAPEIIVEKVEPEAPEEYEIEEPGQPEETDIPFPDDFEPQDLEEPFITPDFTEGFTLDDTEFILCFTFDKFADWTGYEGWRFSTDSTGRLIDKNERRFAGLTHRMMEKYMPDILDQYFMEFMFCYTGIMIIGSKGKGYMDWRRARKPVLVEVAEEAPSEILEPEAPAEEAIETPTLPVGAKALGEAGFLRRMRRETA